MIGNDVFKGEVKPPQNNHKAPPASENQKGFLKKLLIEKYGEVSKEQAEAIEKMTVADAKEKINKLMKGK